MSDDIFQEAGFTSEKEWHALVAAADLSTPEKLASFERWKNQDGSKAGLLALGHAAAVAVITEAKPRTVAIEHNIVSVSGGKDSTALLLLALERNTPNLQAVFADTGHEHPQTYEYVQYLNDKVFPIRTIRADFADRIAGKAQYVREKWLGKLTREVPGYWDYVGADEDDGGTGPGLPTPPDPYTAIYGGDWAWVPAVRGMSQMRAEDVIARALGILEKGPTGNPFLDLCIWKGRFPSTRARFCSEELKRNPIIEQVQMPLLDAGHDIISWQGVRADESPARATLPERDLVGGGPDGGELWNFRPILAWTVEDVFAMHRKHGIEPNPLYKQGMGRVGCMPCIHARKDELLEIARRFPEEFERVAEWERIVSVASKRGSSTFFEADTIAGNSREMAHISHETHGIYSVIEWAKTGRGGRQYDMFRVGGEQEEVRLCSSIYGLCE